MVVQDILKVVSEQTFFAQHCFPDDKHFAFTKRKPSDCNGGGPSRQHTLSYPVTYILPEEILTLLFYVLFIEWIGYYDA